jgi:hypothetical protein
MPDSSSFILRLPQCRVKRCAAVTRRLLNLLTSLSLLLCVAVVVLWVRGYFVGERMGWQYGEPVIDKLQGTIVRSGAGGVGARLWPGGFQAVGLAAAGGTGCKVQWRARPIGPLRSY